MEKTNNKTKSFERQGIIVFAMSIFASGLNYLFQILSGRILDPASYGELNSIFSIMNIVAIIGNSLGLSIVKYIAETKDESKQIGANVIDIFRKSIIVGIPLACILSFVMTTCMKYNIVSSILSSFSMMMMCIAFVLYGVLQGKKEFFQVGIYNLLQPLSKIIIGTALLLLGLHYNFVFVAISFGALLCILYARKTNPEILTKITDKREKSTTDEIYKYFFFTLISMICLTAFNNIDVLLVRNHFNEMIVGQYSSAALFGKIILYIPQALTIMMVPIVAEHNGNEKKTLFKTTAYSLGLSMFASVALYVLRNFVIKILMGEKYLPSADYILPVCCMMLPLVGITVFINYMVAFGDKWFASISGIVGIATIILISGLTSSSVNLMIYSISVVYIIMFMVLMCRCVIITNRQYKCKIQQEKL